MTFLGERHAMQQLALHASAVAAHHLAGTPMAGDYFTASMRTPEGTPAPISWTAVDLRAHPACLLHDTPAANCTSEQPTEAVA